MEKKERLILPLQFFADEGSESNSEDKTEEKGAEEKTYTQAELDAETSKRVENALKKREAAQQKAVQEAIDKAIKEAEAKSKMTEKERMDADLKAREDALKAREEAAAKKEFLVDVTAELSTQGLPASLAELVVGSATRETADQLITKIKSDWDEAVKEQVKGLARQKDAKAPGTGLGDMPALDLSAMAQKNRKVR